mmetsp:Transcript_15954/g.24707  ORF Transcript_15954/g.24707 Transcript_15954/m.24707 type:complete len:81 (+) Transcript_15954:300-542(+)
MSDSELQMSEVFGKLKYFNRYLELLRREQKVNTQQWIFIISIVVLAFICDYFDFVEGNTGHLLPKLVLFGTALFLLVAVL